MNRFSYSVLLLFLSLNVGRVYSQTEDNEKFIFASKLYEDKLYDVAASQLNEFLESYPNSPLRMNALSLLGNSYFNLKNFSDARRIYFQMEEEYHGTAESEEAFKRAALASEELGDFIPAAVTFKKFTAYYPNSKFLESAYLASGFNYLKGGMDDLTLSILQELLDLNPESEKSLVALTVRATVFENKDRYVEALNELELAENHKQSKKHLSLILHSKGRLQTKLSDYKGAAKTLERLAKLSKDDVEVQKGLLLLGDLELSGRKYNSAYKRYRSVEKKAKAGLKNDALLRMGDAKVLSEKYVEALKEYRKIAVRSLPENEKTLLDFRIGYALEQSGKPLDALNSYTKVLQQTSTDDLKLEEETLKRLVDLSLKLNDTRAALNFCVSYLKDNPAGNERIYFAFRAAEIYRQLGEFESAVTYYKLVTVRSEKNPMSDDASFGLAKSYFELGRIEESLEELERSAALFPGSSNGKNAEILSTHIEEQIKKESVIGFERLAELMGDLISGKSREGLQMELASIYYEEMKDFERAERMLKNVSQSTASDSIKATALFMRGDINLKLAAKAVIEQDGEMAKFYKQQARFVLTDLSQKYPAYENISTVAYFLAKLLDGTDEEKLSSMRSFVKRYPKSEFRGKALFNIGNYQMSSGNLRNARKTFERIIKEFPLTSESERAAMRIATISARESSGERERLDLSYYLRRYPGGADIVRAKYLMGNSLFESGDQAKAMKQYSDIMENHYYSEYVDSVSSKRGMVYYNAGEYELALENFISGGGERSWFSDLVLPYNIPVVGEELYYAGSSSEKLGDMRMAKSFYRRYLQWSGGGGNSAIAAQALLSIYESENDPQNIKPLLRSLINKKWNADVASGFHAKLADLYFDAKDYPLARSEYEIAKSLLPAAENKEFTLKILTCYFREGKITDAERVEAGFKNKYLNTATNDERALLLYERGMYLKNKKETAAAKRHFKEITKNFPKSRYGASSEFELALLEILDDKKQDALSRLSEIADNYPGSDLLPEVYLEIGKIFYSAQQYTDAIEYYKKAIDIPEADDSRETAYSGLIRSYEEAGLLEPALSTAIMFSEKYPYSDIIFNVKMKIGSLLMNIGDYEKAVKHWEALLPYADSESTAEILFWRGEGYFNTGDYSRAIAEYLKVSYLGKPTKLDWGASAWWKAGNAYEELGDYEKSAILYRKIISEKGALSNFGKFAQQRIDTLRQSGKIEEG